LTKRIMFLKCVVVPLTRKWCVNEQKSGSGKRRLSGEGKGVKAKPKAGERKSMQKKKKNGRSKERVGEALGEGSIQGQKNLLEKRDGSSSRVLGR